MKNVLSLVVLVMFAFYSCNTSQKESNSTENDKVAEKTELDNTIPKLYITTFTFTDTGANQKADSAITVINSDYFEVSLYSLVDKSKGYYAKKDIENATSLDNYRYIFLEITTKDAEDVYFKNSTEFLNYMSEHNYEMVDQEKHQYRTDYTFKKKS